MNKRTFDKLPNDLKVVVNNWARAKSQAETQQAFLKVAVIGRGKFKKAGMKFHTLSAAEQKRWQDTYAGVTEAYLKDAEAKGLPARKMVTDIKALVEKYSNKTFNDLMSETIKKPVQDFSPGI